MFYVYFISTVPPPPTNPSPLIAAIGENITLSCPLQTAPDLERFYTVEWRYPTDNIIVETGSRSRKSWASVNDDTLALTVGPYNSSLPSTFQCAALSFGRVEPRLMISQTTIGTIQVIIPSKFLHVTCHRAEN